MFEWVYSRSKFVKQMLCLSMFKIKITITKPVMSNIYEKFAVRHSAKTYSVARL